MHNEVMCYVRDVKAKLPNYFTKKKVYEIGSRNINGSVRSYFTNCDYTGFDLDMDAGVDVVMDWSVTLPTMDPADVVVCCEVLEHCKGWKQMLRNILDNTKSGGLVLITAAGVGRPEHGTTATSPADSPNTNDYYKNITMKDICSVYTEKDFSVFEPSYLGTDIRFWGIKK